MATVRQIAAARRQQARRPGEDPVTWALRTQRISPEKETFWRQRVAASAQAATDVLAALAPGTAAPTPGADGHLDDAALVEAERELHSGAFDYSPSKPARTSAPRRRVSAAAPPATAGDAEEADPELDELIEQEHGHSDRAQEVRRIDHMRAVVAGRSVACGHDRGAVAAMAAELAEYDAQEVR